MKHLLLLLAASVLAGCSSLSDATIPAQQNSVSYEPPDTIRRHHVPPVPSQGELTRPESVAIYADTASSPTSDVESVEVDREEETVIVRSRSGDSTVAQTYRLPAYGEMLRLRSDSVAFDGRVAGAPTAEDVEVVTSSIDKPWHHDVAGWLWTIAAMMLGAGVLLLLFQRLIP